MSTDAPCAPSPPTVQNVVLTCNAGCAIYLPGLARSFVMCEYNPLRFSAVTIRLVRPKSTALVFGSGKIVITGSKTRYEAILAAYKYINIVRQHVKADAHLYAPRVQNIVASASFGHHIDLAKMRRLSVMYSNYEPELFPGLIWRGNTNDTSMVVLVFCSGKLIITGAKVETSIPATYALIVPLLRECVVDREAPPPEAPPAPVNEPHIENLVGQIIRQEGLFRA